MKKYIYVLLFALFCLPGIYACDNKSGNDVVEDDKWASLEKGKTAKDFTLKDLTGKSISLSDYKGKIVFLNFWATWCAPCRHEMPSMEKVHKKYKGGDFVVLAVATDNKGEEIVKPFIDEHGYTLPVLIDKNSDVSDSYSVFALPTTFIIGRDGKIIEMVQGVREWDSKEILDYFDELILTGDPDKTEEQKVEEQKGDES